MIAEKPLFPSSYPAYAIFGRHRLMEFLRAHRMDPALRLTGRNIQPFGDLAAGI